MNRIAVRHLQHDSVSECNLTLFCVKSPSILKLEFLWSSLLPNDN